MSFKAGLTAFALLLFAANAAAAECRADRVDLRQSGAQVSLTVEIADDPEERARGLMFRESLPQFSGMLFIYEVPQTASFWMRNTLIPLDLLFLDARGVVQHIHENAIPLDETAIPGGDDILAVLEINGGLSAILGLRPGAQMKHPAFGSDAVWSCGR